MERMQANALPVAVGDVPPPAMSVNIGGSPLAGAIAGAVAGAPASVSPSMSPSSKGGFRGTPDNAKTKLCMRWSAGECRFGDRCNFAHGEHELRLPSRRETLISPTMPAAGMPPLLFSRANSYPTAMYQLTPGQVYPPPVYMVNPQQVAIVGGPSMPVTPQMHFAPAKLVPRAHSVDIAAAAQHRSLPPSSFSTPTKYSPPMINAAEKPADVSMESWISRGCPVLGPNGWCKYQTPEGKEYFHNFNTGVTQWEVPHEYLAGVPPAPPMAPLLAHLRAPIVKA
eukprot:TRINITY_DN589_c0_g1_i2.p7 TRINITY_DN589_c0_g1~~TRINITY_DN589_c0_g1_i2.p7  ORF type:complete len:282 (-),score=27.43 TRINITY_DN589_c0_g1_i2:5034-5879(-)